MNTPSCLSLAVLALGLARVDASASALGELLSRAGVEQLPAVAPVRALPVPSPAAAPAPERAFIAPDLAASLRDAAPGQRFVVLITVRVPPPSSPDGIGRAAAAAAVAKALDGLGASYELHGSVFVSALTREQVEALARLPQVRAIEPNRVIRVPNPRL